jgi:YD repeat-containing protein
VTSPRRLLVAGLLAGAAVVPACNGSKTTSPTCMSFASAAALCEVLSCDETWAAVQTDPAYCDHCGNVYRAGDCGDYHVLTYAGVDFGGSYYYRRDTGALVAVQHFSPPSPTGTCDVVGTAAFSFPASCDTTTFSPLPGWCPPDPAGQRVFPCCGETLAGCTSSVFDICPASWADAQAQAPSLCEPDGGSDPALGACGGDHVLRYRRQGRTPMTLYYDASGNLIAAIDETIPRCQYGPPSGLTLPACGSTLTSACADGGAAP